MNRGTMHLLSCYRIFINSDEKRTDVGAEAQRDRGWSWCVNEDVKASLANVRASCHREGDRSQRFTRRSRFTLCQQRQSCTGDRSPRPPPAAAFRRTRGMIEVYTRRNSEVC
jgi:hypothetical protein